LDISNEFTPSSPGSAPNNPRYRGDDIKEVVSGTLLYVKGMMLRTIKVVNAIVMSDRIMHGQPIPSVCAMVQVTTIREGHKFEDLDNSNKEEGTEKTKDAKGNFILCACKDLILKMCSSLIVSPQSKEDEGAPTSKKIMPLEDPHSHHSL
jgi:hypothetical protein